ncbi:MAG: pilus assembly protein PilM [Bacillota bacterium]
MTAEVTEDFPPSPEAINEEDDAEPVCAPADAPGPARAEAAAEESTAASRDLPPVLVGEVAGRARGFLGVDIGSRWLKIVQAELHGKVLTIWRYATYPVPEGIVAGGQVQDLHRVASLLREATSLFRGRRSVGVVDGQRAIMRQVELPLMGRRELEAMLRLQGDHYLPLPWADAEIDFAVLGQSRQQMRVLLVGAHSDTVRGLARAMEMGGLAPVALETDSVALARALEIVAAVSPDAASGGSSVTGPHNGAGTEGILTIGVHLGAMGTLVFASQQGTPLLARTIPLGGDHFTRALARDLGIDENTAEAYKRARGLEIPELRPGADRLASEITKTVEYCLDQSERGLMPRVHLTGGGARLVGFCEVLTSWLEPTLARWSRLPSGTRWIGVAQLPGENVRWAVDPHAFGPEHFLALGLSLRGSTA